MQNDEIIIRAFWDEEASVWVAETVDETIGLVTEAATLDELKDRVLAVLPELLSDNVSGTRPLTSLTQVCVQSQFSLAMPAA